MRLILVLFVGLSAALALADGCFFSKEPEYREVTPSIPSQRAVIKFDGKEQVLLVESDLGGPVGNYGWVVPLPARPSYVKSVSPTYIDQSFEQAQPRVNGGASELGPAIGAAFLIGMIALSSAWRRRELGIPARTLWLTFELALAVGIMYFLYPVYAHGEFAARAGASDAAKLDVESLGVVGAYEVSVVSGEDPKAIEGWLKEHGFALPPKAQPVLAAYAKENWVFLAAQVRKDWTGIGPPHPLKAVFPTTEAVYPMRLTGLQKDVLRLELLVVSDRTASIEGMKMWRSSNSPINVAVQVNADDAELFEGWSSGLYAMAKGQQWTYLRGDIQPDQMREDFKLVWSTPQRFEREVWEFEAARSRATKVGLDWIPWIAAVLGLAMALMPKPTERLFVIALLATVLGGVIVGANWYGGVEKVQAEAAWAIPKESPT